MSRRQGGAMQKKGGSAGSTGIGSFIQSYNFDVREFNLEKRRITRFVPFSGGILLSPSDKTHPVNLRNRSLWFGKRGFK
jgi:hypothetical protein